MTTQPILIFAHVTFEETKSDQNKIAADIVESLERGIADRFAKSIEVSQTTLTFGELDDTGMGIRFTGDATKPAQIETAKLR